MPVLANRLRITGITNPVKVQACNYENPATVYDEITYSDLGAPPFTASVSYLLNVPAPGVYLLRVLEIPPGNPAGNLILDGADDNGTTVTVVKDDLEFVVDRGEEYDPVNGGNSFRHPDLKGANFRVVQRGNGPLQEVEWTYSEDGDDGVVTIDIPGFVFNPGDTFFVQFIPSVVQEDTATTNNVFNGEILITTNTVYDNSHKNKRILFRASANKVEYELPDLDSFPENTIMAFEANGGNQVYAAIKTFGSQVIDFKVPNQVNTTKIGLAQNEQVWLCKKGTTGNFKWQVLMANWAYNDLGTDILSAVKLPNTLVKDGSLKDKSVYWRIWDKVLDGAADYPVKTDAEWDDVDGDGFYINKGFFADVDSNNFRLPDDRDMYYRATNGSKTIGSREQDQNKQHNHNVVDGGKTYDRLLAVQTPGENVTVATTDISNPSGTEPNVTVSRPMANNGGAEVRVKGVIKWPLIKI